MVVKLKLEELHEEAVPGVINTRLLNKYLEQERISSLLWNSSSTIQLGAKGLTLLLRFHKIRSEPSA